LVCKSGTAVRIALRGAESAVTVTPLAGTAISRGINADCSDFIEGFYVARRVLDCQARVIPSCRALFDMASTSSGANHHSVRAALTVAGRCWWVGG